MVCNLIFIGILLSHPHVDLSPQKLVKNQLLSFGNQTWLAGTVPTPRHQNRNLKPNRGFSMALVFSSLSVVDSCCASWLSAPAACSWNPTRIGRQGCELQIVGHGCPLPSSSVATGRGSHQFRSSLFPHDAMNGTAGGWLRSPPAG